jgi:hypothetical protein
MTFMAMQLHRGKYIVLGVYIDRTGGDLGIIVGNDLDGSGTRYVPHWVGVIAVYDQYVLLVDPYSNCVRLVPRSVIEEAMNNFGKIIVINPPQGDPVKYQSI